MDPGWLRLAATDTAQRIATWPWRLGLGWLVGRRLVLVSTYAPQQTTRRTLVPAHLVDGDVLLAGLPGALWQEDVDQRPIVNVQASPGPLAARVTRLHTDGDDRVRWYRARAAGGIAPEMVAPDLIWVWPVAGLALMAARRLRH